jgi:hypothetical protein
MSPREDTRRRERRARLFIHLRALAVLLGYLLLTWIIHRVYMRRHVPDPELSLALSFTLQQVMAIFTLLGVSFSVKFARYYRTRRAARFHPLIREKLTLHLTGLDQWAILERISKRHLREAEDCLVEILAAVNGAETQRLAEVARQFGLFHKWQKQCRSRSIGRRRRAVSRLCLLGAAAHSDLLDALQDSDGLVRLEAARALARTGEPHLLAEVFRMALDQSLLARAILTEGLRPHAAELYSTAVPEALRSSNSPRIVAALDMLQAWGKSAAIAELHGLLSHPDPAVRAAVLRLVPQAGISGECEEQIWRALAEGGSEVRTAAAEVCGKLRLSSATLLLKGAMEDAAPDAVLAAAYALAQLGTTGCGLLEAEVVAGHAFRAAAALEALERVKLNRAVTVGM